MSVEGYLPKILPICQSSTWQCLTPCCIVMVSVMSTVIIQLSPTLQSRSLRWTDEILLDQDSHLQSPLRMFWQVAGCCYKPGPGSTCHQSQPAAITRHNYSYLQLQLLPSTATTTTEHFILYTSKHVVHRDSRKLWNCGAWSVVIIAKVTSFKYLLCLNKLKDVVDRKPWKLWNCGARSIMTQDICLE